MVGSLLSTVWFVLLMSGRFKVELLETSVGMGKQAVPFSLNCSDGKRAIYDGIWLSCMILCGFSSRRRCLISFLGGNISPMQLEVGGNVGKVR